MRFRKSLAKFYLQWFRDSHDSAIYCMNKGDFETANRYLVDADRYFKLINEYWDAIEFFSIKDNAFLLDKVLPIQFRGFE